MTTISKLSKAKSKSTGCRKAYLEKDDCACETLRTRVLFHELRSRGKLEVFHRYVRGEVSREAVFKSFPDVADIAEARVIRRAFGDDRHHTRIISRLRVALKFHGANKVHVLLGGPPCQAYSLVGRSRDPDRMEDDDRHFLYQHYLDVLADLQPDFFVLENVPGIFTHRKRSEVMSRIRGRGNKQTEVALAKLLRAAGVTGWRRQVRLPLTETTNRTRRARSTGVRPDFVFRKQRVVVFVDGCFWHGCPKHSPPGKWLRKSSMPSTCTSRPRGSIQRNRLCSVWSKGIPGISWPAYFPARRSRNQSCLTLKDAVHSPVDQKALRRRAGKYLGRLHRARGR